MKRRSLERVRDSEASAEGCARLKIDNHWMNGHCDDDKPRAEPNPTENISLELTSKLSYQMWGPIFYYLGHILVGAGWRCWNLLVASSAAARISHGRTARQRFVYACYLDVNAVYNRRYAEFIGTHFATKSPDFLLPVEFPLK